MQVTFRTPAYYYWDDCGSLTAGSDTTGTGLSDHETERRTLAASIAGQADPPVTRLTPDGIDGELAEELQEQLAQTIATAGQ